jgi:hypothetical protein
MRPKSITLAGLLIVTSVGWTGLSGAQSAPTWAEPAANGPKATLKSLAAQVATLMQTVQTLTQNVQTLQSQLASANAQNAFALGQFVTVDTKDTINGLKPPHIIFSGGNLHVRSGSGESVDATGLGNLVVGYDSDAGCGANNPATIDADRGGSHNLVLGDCNRYTSSRGLVAGFDNKIAREDATITGGDNNEASGTSAHISGGNANFATGDDASVSGGSSNQANGADSSVTGGVGNVVNGTSSSIAGGNGNKVTGKESFIGGGENQTIAGDHLFN